MDRAIDIRRRECRAVCRPLYTTDATERARRVEEYTRRRECGKPLWPQDEDRRADSDHKDDGREA